MKQKALVTTPNTSLSLKNAKQLMLVTEHILNAKALADPKILWLSELVLWAAEQGISDYQYNPQLARWQGFPHRNKDILQLKQLDVRGNHLTELPLAIGRLQRLTLLDVGWNQLTKLPTSLANLTSLTELCLNQNYLKRLPNFIGKLTKLNILH